MDPDHAILIEHLNGLILLAHATWQSSSGKCADIARTFRFVARLHQAAALAYRDNPAGGLQVLKDGIP
jgi:hypothetical protein